MLHALGTFLEYQWCCLFIIKIGKGNGMLFLHVSHMWSAKALASCADASAQLASVFAARIHKVLK